MGLGSWAFQIRLEFDFFSLKYFQSNTRIQIFQNQTVLKDILKKSHYALSLPKVRFYSPETITFKSFGFFFLFFFFRAFISEFLNNMPLFLLLDFFHHLRNSFYLSPMLDSTFPQLTQWFTSLFYWNTTSCSF